MDQMRFAIIGCGRILKKHLNAIDDAPRAKLVAVCDVAKEKANEAAEKTGAIAYYDYHEMFAKEDFDVAIVLTGSNSHASVVTDISQYGKHIIVEKPIALCLVEAQHMIDACKKNNCRLFVVKQNRYNKAVQQARKAFDEGRFGKLALGTVRVRWMRTQEYYDRDDWRGTFWGDGGAFTNQASHHIDLLQWFFGEIESVMCMTATQFVDIEAEDTGVAVLRFKSGALGVIEATTAARPKDLEGSLSILGENGTVVIAGFAVNTIETWNFSDQTPEDELVPEKYKELPDNVYGFGHKQFLKDVISAIQTGAEAPVSGEQGKKSLAIIHALYVSAKTRKEVFLKDNPIFEPLGKKP